MLVIRAPMWNRRQLADNESCIKTGTQTATPFFEARLFVTMISKQRNCKIRIGADQGRSGAQGQPGIGSALKDDSGSECLRAPRLSDLWVFKGERMKRGFSWVTINQDLQVAALPSGSDASPHPLLPVLHGKQSPGRSRWGTEGLLIHGKSSLRIHASESRSSLLICDRKNTPLRAATRTSVSAVFCLCPEGVLSWLGQPEREDGALVVIDWSFS